MYFDDLADFVSYINKEMMFTPNPSLDWSGLLSSAPKERNVNDWLKNAMDWYAPRQGDAPQQDAAMAQLMEVCVHHAIDNGERSHWLRDAIPGYVNAWTQGGCRDMSAASAAALGPSFGKWYQKSIGGRDHRPAEAALYLSSNLWKQCGHIFLNLPQEKRTDEAAMLMRHAPHLLGPVDAREFINLHMQLFGAFHKRRVPIDAVESMLVPENRTAATWVYAFAFCRTSPNQEWVSVEKALSAIALDAKDPRAWQLWSSIHAVVHPTFTPVLTRLCEVHHDFDAAYRALWPTVSALYERDAQFAAAAEHAAQRLVANDKNQAAFTAFEA